MMPRYRLKTYEYVCDGCNRNWIREQRTDDLVPPPKWKIYLTAERKGYNIHTKAAIYCDNCKVPEVSDDVTTD